MGTGEMHIPGRAATQHQPLSLCQTGPLLVALAHQVVIFDVIPVLGRLDWEPVRVLLSGPQRCWLK